MSQIFTSNQVLNRVTSFLINNNTYLRWKNAAGSGNIDVLKVDGSDDTWLNADSGDIINFSIAGTSQVTVNTPSLITLLQTGAMIRRNVDSDGLLLCGGTNNAAANGSYINLLGSNSAPGRVDIYSGNQSGSHIDLKVNHASAYVNLYSSLSAARHLKSISTTVNCSGATSTASNLIPAKSTLIAVVCRVTTAITGATSFDIGDGSDADRWGDDVAITLNTQTTQANFTAAPGGWSASAGSVVLTANGSNFSGGVVRVTAFYEDYTGSTS